MLTLKDLAWEQVGTSYSQADHHPSQESTQVGGQSQGVYVSLAEAGDGNTLREPGASLEEGLQELLVRCGLVLGNGGKQE